MSGYATHGPVSAPQSDSATQPFWHTKGVFRFYCSDGIQCSCKDGFLCEPGSHPTPTHMNFQEGALPRQRASPNGEFWGNKAVRCNKSHSAESTACLSCRASPARVRAGEQRERTHKGVKRSIPSLHRASFIQKSRTLWNKAEPGFGMERAWANERRDVILQGSDQATCAWDL